jgi:integrase/recombinase XerC
MILIRAVRRFGEARPLDAVPAAELRAWLLELRATLAPESIAGYVRGLKAFGNWCAAEELAAAAGFRGLRRPKVPHRLIAPFSDPELRSLLALADERERALALVLLDTGLRLSELASLRVGDVRPDGTLHDMGKGAKERIVPIGASARRALVRYLGTRTVVVAGDPLFCGRWGPALTARGIQLAIARLGRRAAVGTRCSPHTFRHTFARGYLVNGGDVFSLQQILGHTTLDMVRRYVYFVSFETVRRLHAAASPADGLLIGPKVSLFIPRAWASVLMAIV